MRLLLTQLVRHGPRLVCRLAYFATVTNASRLSDWCIMALIAGRGCFCALHWLSCLWLLCEYLAAASGMSLGLCVS